jgi:hypothetical protein
VRERNTQGAAVSAGAGGWGPQEWAALTAMGVALMGTVGAGMVHAARVSYRLGRSDEEQANLKALIGKLEARADAADAQQSAVKVLQGALEALKEQVIEMRQDLKNLMTGRIGARRRDPGATVED